MATISPLVRRGALAEAERLAGLAPGPALGAQVRLLTLLGSEEPLPVLLDALARSIETWAPSVLCSILLTDTDRQVLTLGAAPRLPRSFLEAVGEIPIRAGVGCCGTAAATGQPVVVSDIARSSLWTDYVEAALAHGLRACWSVPMLDDQGGVIGTVALYFTESREPTEDERQLVDFAAALGRMVLLRQREADDHRMRERRLRVLMRHSTDAVLVVRNGRIMYSNDRGIALLGLPVGAGVTDLPLDPYLSVDPGLLAGTDSPRVRTLPLRTPEGAAQPVEVIAVDVPLEAQATTILTLRELSTRHDLEYAALEAAERDRERTANDLHDGVCQQLAGIDYLLTAMIANAGPTDASGLREVRGLVESALRDTSLMAAWLLPLAHHPDGLAGGLAQLRRTLLDSRRLQFDLDCDATFARTLPETLSAPLFGLLQSATLHALTAQSAQRLAISVAATDHGVRAQVQVDNARFVDPAADVELRALRYRARRVGALLAFDAIPDGGSRCVIEFIRGHVPAHR